MAVKNSISPLYQQVKLQMYRVNFEIDCGANDTLYSKETWVEIGKSKLLPIEGQYKVADGSHCKYLDSLKPLLNWRANLRMQS